MKYIENIYQIIKKEVSVSLVLIVYEGDEQKRLKLNINEDIAKEFYELLKKRLELIHNEMVNGEKVIEEYDASSKDSSIYRNISEKHIDFKEIKEDLENVSNLDLAELNINLLSKLWAFAIVLKTEDGDELYYFIKHKPSAVVSRDKFLAFFISDLSLSKVNRNLIIFQRRIDGIYYNGEFLILNKNNFELTFGFIELFRENAKKLMDYFTRFDFKIESFDSFKTSCLDNSIMVRKLSNIYVKNNYTSLSFDILEKVKKEFKLTMELKEDSNGKRIIFHGKREYWQLLNFLEDDYLSSISTRNKYEVHSKKQIK